MKIAITVSQITPGGGLTKYICSLTEVLISNTDNEVWIVTTHKSESNPALDNLKKCGRVMIVGLGNLGKIKKYISLIKLLQQISPDLLIVNYNAPTQYVLPFLPKHIKTVHILHNNTSDFYRVAAINGKHTTAWIAPTPALARYFNDFTNGIYRDRITTISHGVELSSFEPKKSNELLQLTYVGVLYEHKGVKILPSIIKQLRTSGRKFHFTFIGEGILREELENELKSEIDAGVVEFTGRIPGDEVYKRLSETDIFVYPTHIDAFGLVIAEAMINGAVPVVTLLEGITDSLVDEGKNGFLVNQDDINVFVERILQLIDDPTLRTNMSNSALEKAKIELSLDRMKSNYLEYFNKLLSN